MLCRVLPAVYLLASASAFSLVPSHGRTPARIHAAASALVLRGERLTRAKTSARTVSRPALRMVLDESQQKFTAERLAVMSKGEIQHIFEDIDKDGSGGISYDEFDFLERYFGESSMLEILNPHLVLCLPQASQRGACTMNPQFCAVPPDLCKPITCLILAGDTWDKAKKAKLFEDLDTDENGMIDALEFYDWVIHNVKLTKRDGLGQRTLSVRDQRVKLGVENIPLHLTALLDELGCGGIEQKVTHPLHSAFGRTLRDHFVSSYILAEQWGNPPDVVVAALFHALYQRGDGMQAVKAADMRVPLQERLGKDVEPGRIARSICLPVALSCLAWLASRPAEIQGLLRSTAKENDTLTAKDPKQRNL